MTKNLIPLLLTSAFLVLANRPLMAVEANAEMPDCALSAISGSQENTKLSQLKGKVLYVDFWASWCGPCAKSFPFLNQIHQELKDRGLQIVGVNLDENLDDAKDFLAQHPAEFTVLTDASSEKNCAKDFAVKAMPSSYIIDKQGKVHHVHLGFKAGEAEELKTITEKLLAEK